MTTRRDGKGRFLPGKSGNPAGRPRKFTAEPRGDGWTSTLTGIGTLTHDKRQNTSFCPDFLSIQEAADLWRGDDIAARVVELVPSEMLREGWDVSLGESDQTRALKIAPELGLKGELWDALAFERAYGGSAILLGAQDGAPLEEPLDLDRVRSVDFLQTFEPEELTPTLYYSDPSNPKLGRPSHYLLSPIESGASSDRNHHLRSVILHESRLVIFPGIRVTKRRLATTSNGWGDSVLNRVHSVLRDFNAAWASTSILLTDFAQAVFKIKGLAELIAADQNKVVQNRIAAVELSRSVARAVLIDAEGEDWERKQTPVTGLPELLDKFATRLAAAADMPLTLLMGQSPAGLNATGESDLRFFYDRVSGLQERKLKPGLLYLLQVLAASQNIDPSLVEIEFRPLWQPSSKELAETRNIQSQTDSNYINAGVVSPEEIAIARFSTPEDDFTTMVDFEARRLVEEMEPEAPTPSVTPPEPNEGGEIEETDDENAETEE